MANNWVLSEQDGAVLELTLNRPERKNALNLVMYQQLTAELKRAAQDKSVRVLILSGSGGCFSSGNDLEDFVKGAGLTQPDSPIALFMHALLEFPKPVVAAVDGVAIGIGTTLLLHCDLVYASPVSEFKLPFAQLGLCPEFASSRLLPRLLGHAKASEWLLLGKAFSAADCAAFGLINRVVDAPLTVARQQAQQLAAMAPAALRRTKALMREPLLTETRMAIAAEGHAFGEALCGPEFAEAAAAFFAKRPPDFSDCE